MGLSRTNIRLIFLRELRDQLRDRRTLFMIAVLPLLLYPALGIGMVQLTVLFTEQPRTVVILGADDLPDSPVLVEADHFREEWFEQRTDAEKLLVVSDSPQKESTPERDRLLEEARGLLALRVRHRAAREKVRAAGEGETAENATLVAEERALREEIGDAFSRSGIQVLILVPEKFDQHLAARNEEIRKRDEAAPSASFDRPEILYNRADDKSYLAYNRTRDVFDAWEATILKSQLEAARLPDDLPHPVRPTSTNLALDAQISANLWGKLFPALLVMMSITGAFYPAIDLVAGEKERGTMETLLICPAKRAEIVLGKFFTVLTFSVTTALLNLFSMGLTGRHIVSMASGGMYAEAGGFALPPASAMAWVLILLVPLAALFSALSLALATFARSSKEGQYYLTPLLMVTLGLTVFCMSPGVELKPQYSVVPIANIALLLKGLLLSPLNSGSLLWYIPAVLGSSVVYGGLALWWAIDQFSREEVLFREAERFDVRLWLRQLFLEKGPFPSFAEAVFCFVLMMILQFAMMRVFQSASVATPEGGLKALMTQQLALIATPALIMGVMLTSSFRRTFRLRWPPLSILAVALVLPFVLHPVVFELGQLLQQRFFDPLPKHVREAMAALVSPDMPTWLVLLAFAVTPAVCEEIAFRGFILSGFLSSRRVWLAVTLSSLTFGLIHLIPQQVLNAALLGVVLGLLAVRSGSLLPSFVFHLLHNGLMVLHSLHSEKAATVVGANPFATVVDGALRYHWPLVTLCTLAGAGLIVWLARHPSLELKYSRAEDFRDDVSPRDAGEVPVGPAAATSGVR
jgi:sodium transport system permease protein